MQMSTTSCRLVNCDKPGPPFASRRAGSDVARKVPPIVTRLLKPSILTRKSKRLIVRSPAHHTVIIEAY